MKADGNLTRRRFVQTGVAAGAAALFGPFSIRDGHAQSPNERLQVAVIGCGGRGWPCIQMAGGGCTFVAFCDVDDRPDERRDKAYAKYPDVPHFKDYRRMFDRMQDDIDAVIIATPDHSHYHAAMSAIIRGKHVYLEKPLTHTVWEARKLAEAARRHDVATQMGNTGHSNHSTAVTRDWILAGSIGEVRRVICHTAGARAAEGPPQKKEVPDGLAWDLWLNRAHRRPYSPAYVPKTWRCWRYFGEGKIGDWGCHTLDAAWYALDLGAPERVEAEPVGDWSVKESYPQGERIAYHFPARGQKPPVRLEYLLGEGRSGVDLELPDHLRGQWGPSGYGGGLIIGEEASIRYDAYGGASRIVPEQKMRQIGRPPQKAPRVRGHMGSWLEACKDEGMPLSNFAYAGPLTEMVLLGEVALRRGRPIEWDAETLRVTNDEEANALIHGPEPRTGWEIG